MQFSAADACAPCNSAVQYENKITFLNCFGQQDLILLVTTVKTLASSTLLKDFRAEKKKKKIYHSSPKREEYEFCRSRSVSLVFT
jgi:hypothetical protein